MPTERRQKKITQNIKMQKKKLTFRWDPNCCTRIKQEEVLIANKKLINKKKHAYLLKFPIENPEFFLLLKTPTTRRLKYFEDPVTRGLNELEQKGEWRVREMSQRKWRVRE